MQAHKPTGSPLRVALLADRPGHGFFPQAGRQKFFPSISFSVDASSIVSASRFLSRRFLSSGRGFPRELGRALVRLDSLTFEEGSSGQLADQDLAIVTSPRQWAYSLCSPGLSEQGFTGEASSAYFILGEFRGGNRCNWSKARRTGTPRSYGPAGGSTAIRPKMEFERQAGLA
jgi:hypothetical protein